MQVNWIDRLGDWNPQLLRELKGRLKPLNLFIAGAISLLGQFLLFMYFQVQLPVPREGVVNVQNKYCIGSPVEYGAPKCLIDPFSNSFVINWQLWSMDLFLLLSIISIFALLVAGTYLLISDLANEERRDTLNFVRLSPQSAQNILVGKMLGVPILLYILAVLAVPLHLWAGMTAQIPLSLILSFYGVLIAGCLFFYSAALLFSLISRWLGGFQAWLGSGTVLLFLAIARSYPISNNPIDWLSLFSPAAILSYLASATSLVADYPQSFLQKEKLEMFFLPLGASTVATVSFIVLNYGLWTYWCWQGLQRRFHNPSKTIFSKRQSYLLVACFQVLSLGFAMQSGEFDGSSPTSPEEQALFNNFCCLLVFNVVLFLGLATALTPPRQTLQDWARYRRERQASSSRKSFWSQALEQNLIFGDKSPALEAIALNLIVTSTILVPWAVFGLSEQYKVRALLSLVITLNLILIYAAIAQLVLFLRTQKQALWVTGALSAVTILPPVILGLLSLEPMKMAGLWLFTPFAWLAVEYASGTTVFLAILAQWSIITLCTLQMTRQLRRSGESASKALFAGRASLPGR